MKEKGTVGQAMANNDTLRSLGLASLPTSFLNCDVTQP